MQRRFREAHVQRPATQNRQWTLAFPRRAAGRSFSCAVASTAVDGAAAIPRDTSACAHIIYKCVCTHIHIIHHIQEIQVRVHTSSRTDISSALGFRQEALGRGWPELGSGLKVRGSEFRGFGLRVPAWPLGDGPVQALLSFFLWRG